jgi:hypothetical protein
MTPGAPNAREGKSSKISLRVIFMLTFPTDTKLNSRLQPAQGQLS